MRLSGSADRCDERGSADSRPCRRGRRCRAASARRPPPASSPSLVGSPPAPSGHCSMRCAAPPCPACCARARADDGDRVPRPVRRVAASSARAGATSVSAATHSASAASRSTEAEGHMRRSYLGRSLSRQAASAAAVGGDEIQPDEPFRVAPSRPGGRGRRRCARRARRPPSPRRQGLVTNVPPGRRVAMAKAWPAPAAQRRGRCRAARSPVSFGAMSGEATSEGRPSSSRACRQRRIARVGLEHDDARVGQRIRR